MALASIGGGYQLGDGNVNEALLEVQSAPGATTATSYTFTAADLSNGLFTSTNASAVTLTLPTVAVLEALFVNAKVNSSFDFAIINLGSASGAATVTTATGWTLVGSMAVAITTSARFRARKTGDAAWALYRVA